MHIYFVVAGLGLLSHVELDRAAVKTVLDATAVFFLPSQ